MMPRLHPETKENQHKRFAQHMGSPRRGEKMPGRGIEPRTQGFSVPRSTY